MCGQETAILRPDRNCRCPYENTRVAGEQQASCCGRRLCQPENRQKNRTRKTAQEKLKTADGEKRAARKGYQNPSAKRHGRAKLEHAQHVQETCGLAEIRDQENSTNCGYDQCSPERNRD